MLRIAKWALTVVLLGTAWTAAAWYPPRPVGARLVDVEVYDRTDGQSLPVYRRDGRAWIVGTPGHEYVLRVRNLTGGRILAVTSVDGVNVISGDTAAPSQSGYVLEPYGSVEIAGWRKNLERTAAFYFTEIPDSYAARTGRPENVGVIGVAAFRERPPRVLSQPQPYPYPREPMSERAAPAAPQADARSEASGSSLEKQRGGLATAPAPSLGTGHGRSEWSQAQVVRFERESATPNETVALRYDRYENLVAMGIIGGPPLARSPDPFPGLPRFAPDPPAR
jgi:hypothetical protein